MDFNALVHPLVSSGFGSNVYLLTDEKTVLIDTGVDNEIDTIRQFCHKRGVPLETLDGVILTHAHVDHIMGLYPLLEEVQLRVACHEVAARVLEDPDPHKTLSNWMGFTPPAITVDQKLHDGETLLLGTCELQVISTPGHTPGSICLYEPTLKILFTGDTLFAGGGVGRVDLPGGDAHQLVQSIEQLLGLEVDYLLPGHDKMVTQNAKAAIRASYEYAKLVFV